jgi:hypothetical protein
VRKLFEVPSYKLVHDKSSFWLYAYITSSSRFHFDFRSTQTTTSNILPTWIPVSYNTLKPRVFKMSAAITLEMWLSAVMWAEKFYSNRGKLEGGEQSLLGCWIQNVVPASLPITVSVMTGMDVQLVNSYRNGARIFLWQAGIQVLLTNNNKQVKVNIILEQSVKAQTASKGYSPTLPLTSVLDGGGWSMSCPGCFMPGKDLEPIE